MLRGRNALCSIFLFNERAIYLRIIYNRELRFPLDALQRIVLSTKILFWIRINRVLNISEKYNDAQDVYADVY